MLLTAVLVVKFHPPLSPDFLSVRDSPVLVAVELAGRLRS